MNKKTKLFLLISGVVSSLVLLIIVKFIIDGQYRNSLPEYPDLLNIPKPLQEQITAAGKKASLNPTADNLGELGMVYYSSTYYENAKQCYQLALKKESKKWIWSYYLGYLNLELGESHAAIENFKHVLDKDPKNYLAKFYIAEAFQNLGLTDSAKELFKQISFLKAGDFSKKDTIRDNDFPLQTYASFRLARIYLNSNRLDSAEILLTEILKSQITFGPAYRMLGIVYTKKGNLILAFKYTIRANDLVEYTPPADILIDRLALMSRSDTYLLKQIDDAVRSLNFNWAQKLFDHSLKYIPDNKYLLSKAMYGYLTLGFNDKALPYLDLHFNYYGDDFNELFLFATVLQNRGLNSQAMAYFNQAKNLKPTDSKLALWLSDRQLTDKAVNMINEQLKMEPKNIAILTTAIRLFSNMGDKEKAMTYLTKLIQISPSAREVKRLIGEVNENDGHLKEALSNYEEGLRSDPKNLFIIKHLAALYSKDNKWDKLIRHYRSSLENNPNEPFLLHGLGEVLISCPDTNYVNIKDGEEFSERAYINFKSQFATKLSAAKNLATAYVISGDKQKAAEYMNITINMARKANISPDYILYFETLKKKYLF